MRVILFGSSGQVGTECKKLFSLKGWDVIALSRAEADFTVPSEVYNAVKHHQADIVVNACAYTAVDKAETEPELASLINTQSVASMGKACTELNIPTIHISTDYVFNGQSTHPYKEDDLVGPMGVYGQTKYAGEQSLQEHNTQHIILRTSWVFSAQGNNFVKTMFRLAQSRDEISVVSDQIGCPTYAGDIAAVIAIFIEKLQREKDFDQWGVYHCSNSGELSWFEFAQSIFVEGVKAGVLNKSMLVKAITTSQYPTPTARPAYSVLNSKKLETLLNKPMPDWQLGLSEVCKALALLGSSK